MTSKRMAVGPSRRLSGAASAGAGVILLAALTACSSSSDDDPSSGSPEPSVSTSTIGSATATTSTGAPDVVAVAQRVPAALKAAVSDPVEDPYYPKTSNPEVDVLHYRLDLVYAHPELTGKAVVTFRLARVSDTVRLDLGRALDVTGVRLDEQPARYRHVADGLVTQAPGLDVGTVHTLTIGYVGVPKAASANISRFDAGAGLGWQTDPAGDVFTFQEPYGAWSWFPSNDHPSDEAYVDARITTRSPDVAVFNGTITSTRHHDGLTTTSWHLSQPTATYLVTLAIGPYREYTAPTASGTELSFWLMDQDKRYLPTLRQQAVDGFDWLVDHAGPYPFDSLGFVVVAGNDAMETQTMVTLSRGVFQREDAVIQHEIAHQWYGDSVSPVDWKGLWINEGWAMYMQQWYERDLGGYEYAGGMRQWRSYDNASRLTAGPPANYDAHYFGDLNVYLGPAMMLDKIRQRIGDEQFAEFVKAWAADHAGQNVDRADFTRWADRTTGEDLTALIDRWLDSPTTPPF